MPSAGVRHAWIDDALVEIGHATVSVFDHGVLVGDGVFETLKVVDGRPFAQRRHLARLAHSARGLGLPAPDPARVASAIEAVLAANGLRDARLRVTYTAGVGPLGSDRGNGRQSLIVTLGTLPAFAPVTDVAIVPWPRNERGATAGLKTTSYAENVVALARAKSVGASEAIFSNTTGMLCEGTGSNVFYATGGKLYTPTLASGCLAGVTRALVLEWLEAHERDAPLGALAEADEAFLVSTTRDVQAIRAVDGRALPAAPGPLTRAAMATFAARAADHRDP